MHAEREHEHLAQADRHIAELKQDIARQWQIIEELSMGGQPLHEAISMLRLLKDHLRIWSATGSQSKTRSKRLNEGRSLLTRPRWTVARDCL